LLDERVVMPSTSANKAQHDGPVVITAEPQHADRVYAVLTLAFATDPPNRWMYPEPGQYLRQFPKFARALGGAALHLRTAFVIQDYSAAALWLAPGAKPDEQALMKHIEKSVAFDKRADLTAVIEQMVRYHPEEPHWYLPFIGVDPARQGKGIGAALLRSVLADCDTARLPAYLESTNPRNQAFYERQGFQAVGHIIEGDCPPVVPMLRRAKPW
jgi:ribosomal protein S18 acetylase RimI-like enzyme